MDVVLFLLAMPAGTSSSCSALGRRHKYISTGGVPDGEKGAGAEFEHQHCTQDNECFGEQVLAGGRPAIGAGDDEQRHHKALVFRQGSREAANHRAARARAPDP
ncbi:hypothetical protein BAE44_0010464 [Dichanthelium oligosanthes]|uniref:Secreted protein n=1 Tax=Dichanthelium oligosanthes TaxID=888268 RepID=A0A1E5VTS2_9POAL|nr:hypothetical protein BAE44_0010464 [Dichanthelium oligosanthes]